MSGLPALALQRVSPVKGVPAVRPVAELWAVRAHPGQRRSARARRRQPVGVWPSLPAHGELAPGRNLPTVGPEQRRTPGGRRGTGLACQVQTCPKAS